MKSKKYVIYVKKSFVMMKRRKKSDEFECLVENTEKYITFSVLLKKENDNDKKIKYRLKFNGSQRFMSTSLSNLFDNLSGVYDKNVKNVWKEKKLG